MKHKKHIITLLLAGAMCSLSAQDTVRMTLDSCLRYAYSHNLTLQGAQLNRESASVALSGAKMNFLPSVNASASQGWNWSDGTSRSGNYGINGSLTIFDGLANVSTYRQAKLSQEQSDLALRQSQNSVSAQIVSAYLTILMNREKLSYQREVLETSRKQKEEGELKYSVGKILESDYQLLEANFLAAESELENTRLTIENNRTALASLLCHEGGAIEVVPAADSLTAAGRAVPTFDTVLARSQRNMPDWQLSSLNVDIARSNVSLARSSFLPSLSLNAGTSYNEGNYISDNYVVSANGGLNTSLTLGLSIPLLSRGNSLTAYRKSKIALREAELNHRQTLIDLHDNLEKLHIETLQALNRFRASEALADAYRASYNVYVIKYAQGAVTTVEMLQQQDRYLSALNDWLQNKYSYLLAEKQLDIYTGELRIEN